MSDFTENIELKKGKVTTQMYSFKNDYSEGAHPNILKALIETNMVQEIGYGEDNYSKKAIEILRDKLENKDCDIHFVSGGTQANLIVISAALRPYESVICANTGHINVHETGAIEATGHKVCVVNSEDGKVTPEGIQLVLDEHEDEHMVKPRMVYISNSTEIGTIYKKKELEELSDFCRAKDLLLYLDGARLASALTASDSDLTLPELAKLVDVFYIGGTKNGALLGEAIVINNEKLKVDFRYSLKQKGALFAKGRVLALQFIELFKEDLYFEVGKHANAMAAKLSENIKNLGYGFLNESTSNQIFPILPNEVIEKIGEKYLYTMWSKYDESNSVIRLVTSFATKEEAVDSFINDLKSM